MKRSVWMEQRTQDGLLCSTQQQPPGEVSPTGCWDAVGHAGDVPGRGRHVQPQTLAEQSLLTGGNLTPLLCLSSDLCVCALLSSFFSGYCTCSSVPLIQTEEIPDHLLVLMLSLNLLMSFCVIITWTCVRKSAGAAT